MSRRGASRARVPGAGDHFILTLWRDWLTADLLATLKLNDRQRAALLHTKTAGRITNTDVQELTGASRTTVVRDLGALVKMGLLLRVGERRGSHYVLPKKWTRNEPNDAL